MKSWQGSSGLLQMKLLEILHFSPMKLTEFIDDGLVDLNHKGISVSQQGMLIVRNIAMDFDPQLEAKTGDVLENNLISWKKVLI